MHPKHFRWGNDAVESSGTSSGSKQQNLVILESLEENAFVSKATTEAQFYGDNQRCLPELTHGLQFASAAGFPQFTNYTRDFKDVLDYIFIDSTSLEVVRVADFPPEEVLSAHCALPSPSFPSDHLSLLVDIRFK